MKRVLTAVVVLNMLTGTCLSSVSADDQSPANANKHSVTTTGSSTKALTDDEKRKLEIEARKKAEGHGSSESGKSTVPEKHDENYVAKPTTETTTTTSTDSGKSAGASITYTPTTVIAPQSMTGTSTTTTTQTQSEEAAEHKARQESEKSTKVEAARRAPGYVIVPSSETYYYARQPEPAPLRHNVAFVYAPGTTAKDPAFGIQWTSPKRWGLALWGSGDLIEDSEIIDAVIPHDDYYMDQRKGSYAIEALYSIGSANTMITAGAGVAIDEVENVAVSNVTGWKWEAGKEHTSKFAAQLGIRMRLAGAVSVQYGYDTVQHNFFGLTAEF